MRTKQFFFFLNEKINLFNNTRFATFYVFCQRHKWSRPPPLEHWFALLFLSPLCSCFLFVNCWWTMFEGLTLPTIPRIFFGKCFEDRLINTNQNIVDENHDIAIAMSPSRADPVLPWLGVFKCLYQSHCTVWGYLNI